MITAAEFHPHQCNVFVYSSSKGTIRLCDMRSSALCDRHSKCKCPASLPGSLTSCLQMLRRLPGLTGLFSPCRAHAGPCLVPWAGTRGRASGRLRGGAAHLLSCPESWHIITGLWAGASALGLRPFSAVVTALPRRTVLDGSQSLGERLALRPLSWEGLPGEENFDFVLVLAIKNRPHFIESQCAHFGCVTRGPKWRSWVKRSCRPAGVSPTPRQALTFLPHTLSRKSVLLTEFLRGRVCVFEITLLNSL